MASAGDTGGKAVYQIRVQGKLDDRWSDWFSGLSVLVGDVPGHPPVTILTGPADQAALRGILNKIWDLNLTLLSVVPIEGADPRSVAGGR
jgi:hypothetical protein